MSRAFLTECSSLQGGGAEGSIEDSTVNKRSNLSFMKAVLPKYFNSEW